MAGREQGGSHASCARLTPAAAGTSPLAAPCPLSEDVVTMTFLSSWSSHVLVSERETAEGIVNTSE